MCENICGVGFMIVGGVFKFVWCFDDGCGVFGGVRFVGNCLFKWDWNDMEMCVFVVFIRS